MLNSTQLQMLLLYPVKDPAARKKFLIAAALMLGNFIIPIVPMLLLMGYVARMMRKIIDEKQEPAMPEWDDWSALLTDGLQMLGFRMVVMLPLMVVMFGGLGLYLLFMILGASQSNSHTTSPFIFVGVFIFLITILIFMVLLIPTGIISLIGSTHVAAKRSFAAGFAFKEWWQIFRKNIGAFILYYVIAMAISFALTFLLQILYITIVLICLLPFIFPAIMAYLILIQDALFAQAYAQGRDMLNPTPEPNRDTSVAETV